MGLEQSVSRRTPVRRVDREETDLDLPIRDVEVRPLSAFRFDPAG
ncbi:hypothetical protein [Halalkalicoccus jeotgali]|uniref:Uncharacterized protein n=1 Tax=Halalkalicoccus jeotgali (strain DSM 18796 / CECT 7217 / JCM 14584 / KCTC 4019 / B3) TaxID=795797 RepID=D8JB78_HALJB|nr:hypothetical protein [Halalkalicoccus jeotgali]ADJ16531.1 hypothetical protein HacjB3_15856 [Halalkalicoccus jeotgali B3]ELY41374.1 hypothetical protein C497_01400 [Halalkalicoccus jeotgali B3]